MSKKKHELDNLLLHYGVKGMKWDPSKRQQVVDETIRGNYGNGQERKDQLGERYSEVQDMVNEQLKTGKPAQRPIQESDAKKVKAKSKKKKQDMTILETLKKKAKRAVGDAKEVSSILVKGDYTGKGRWDEDSKTVDRLFDAREAAIRGGKKVTKKLSKVDDVLLKYGKKTIKSLKKS